jgi:small subunit ribosomal protein S18
MAKQRGTVREKPTRRRDKRSAMAGGRRKPCQFCRDKIEQVDYKDVSTLRKFISEKGKIRSRRTTGACRRHQSQIARAIKRARELALLPYVNEGATEGTGGRRDRDRDRDRDR